MLDSAYPPYSGGSPPEGNERERLHDLVSRELAGGRSQIEVVRGLTGAGWPSYEAWQLVETVAGDLTERAPKVAAPKVTRRPAAPRQPMPHPEMPVPAATPAPLVYSGVPACSVCGRQDETLRIVVYPWLVSVVLVSFRRAFVGLWCPRHRLPRHALASLITLAVGWMGIPWGVIFTPLVLAQLAQGGQQPAVTNAEMLRELARIKLEQGDTEGAIRCLESSLQFQDSSTVRLRLHELRAASADEPVGCLATGLPVLDGLIKAAGIGLLSGIAQYLAAEASVLVLDRNATFLSVMFFQWIPLAALLFTGGIAMAQVTEQSLTRLRMRSMPGGIVLGVGVAAVALYSMMEGAALANYVVMLLSGTVYTSIFEAFLDGVLSLLAGGVFWILGPVSQAPVYSAAVGLGIVYFLWLCVRAALRTVEWQQRLHDMDS